MVKALAIDCFAKYDFYNCGLGIEGWFSENFAREALKTDSWAYQGIFESTWNRRVYCMTIAATVAPTYKRLGAFHPHLSNLLSTS